MDHQPAPTPAAIPSVDRILRRSDMAALIELYGRPAATEAVRADLATLRAALADGDNAKTPSLGEDTIVARVADQLEALAAPTLKRVFNLTGTVLHTNLGRAPLPQEALDAIAEVARGASNLEYDLPSGKRGDRDVHLEQLLAEMTGAEAATVVNNNAAAVLLMLNTLASRKEVPVSRGELIEIGGAFRIPAIMSRAGAKLVEVGTTNRTHAKDYAEAIGPRTAMLMKVHTSNYVIEGFTASVPDGELAAMAHDAGLPMAVDLGSGTLVDFTKYGLPHEPTPGEAMAAGVDLVTFSGDKLLGGPQAGLIVGRKELIERIKRNPMKRALRCDKMTIAALAAVLRLYRDPDRLARRLPTLRLLTRSQEEIEAAARRVLPPLAANLGKDFAITIEPSQSQMGSGSLPAERLASAALVIRSATGKSSGAQLKRLASAFRALPVPVIGRIHDDGFWLDLRCLDDEAGFVSQIPALAHPGKS